MFLVKLPQNRHPERSASQIDRVTQRLWRGVEGPRRCLFYPCCSELFDHRSPTTGTAENVPGRQSWGTGTARECLTGDHQKQTRFPLIGGIAGSDCQVSSQPKVTP